MERVAGFWRHIYAEHVPEEAQWVFQKRIKRTWQRLSQKHSRIGIFLSFAYYRIRRGICFHCLLTVRPSLLLLINTHGKYCTFLHLHMFFFCFFFLFVHLFFVLSFSFFFLRLYMFFFFFFQDYLFFLFFILFCFYVFFSKLSLSFFLILNWLKI
jgi:hypothetical protein